MLAGGAGPWLQVSEVSGKWATSGLGTERRTDLPFWRRRSAPPGSRSPGQEAPMTRSIPVRIAGAVLATGAAAAFALAGAGAANAGPQTGQYLAPNGGQVCSNSQYAGYQVRGIGTATFD